MTLRSSNSGRSRVCSDCGRTFRATGVNAKRCPACRPKKSGAWGEGYDPEAVNRRILEMNRRNGSPLTDAEILALCEGDDRMTGPEAFDHAT